MKKMKVRLTGVAPLYMHNNQMVDPLNEFAKRMKKMSGKRSKTEADYEGMAKVEFLGGLYMDENGPVLPARMLAGAFIGGARKSKDGKLAQAGVFFPYHAGLEYDGPREAQALYEAGFWARDPVKIQRNTVMRTRPVFADWSARVEFEYEPTVIGDDAIMTAWHNAGRFCAVGDWRPQNGRFTVEVIAE